MKPQWQKNLWEHSSQDDLTAPPLSGPVRVDLAIIGGGFTGCSAALHAATAGASVCLIDAGLIGNGGSGRNVGLVNAGLWTPPREIIATLGQEAGQKLNTILAAAPEKVFSLIQEHGISCEAIRNGTLHCAHAPKGMRDLEDRYQQLTAIGAPVKLLSATEARKRTGTRSVHGALFDPRAGTIQPYGYVRGLAIAAQRAGAHICEVTCALSAEHQNGGWQIETPNGTIRATAMLQATNAYLTGGLTFARQDYVSVNFCQAATKPLSPGQLIQILPNREGCWDTALVMSSFRLDAAGRLIVGGIGNLDHSGGVIHADWIERKIAALFPQADGVELEFLWHGRIAMTSDHLPKIVQIGPDALSCLGYSGRGIGPGTIFGAAAAAALLGGPADALPLAPVPGHDERFTTARRAYYELGATLTHLTTARFHP